MAPNAAKPTAVMARPIHCRRPRLKSEKPLREHREKHQSAGDHRLYDRELDKRERSNVKQPRHGRTNPSDRPRLAGKQSTRAAKRMAPVDRRCRNRAPVAQQASRVGHQRTDRREGETEEHEYLDSERAELLGVALRQSVTPARFTSVFGGGWTASSLSVVSAPRMIRRCEALTTVLRPGLAPEAKRQPRLVPRTVDPRRRQA